MSARCISRLVTTVLLLSSFVCADNKPKPKDQSRPMTEQSRMALVRALNAEIVYARRAIPAGEKGFTIKDGVVSPGEQQVEMMLAANGPAVKPGDQARITAVQIKKNSLTFEINGGPRKKAKWYQRIQVGGVGGMTPVSSADPNAAFSRGSYVRLEFDKYVPDLTAEQVKQLLKPVLNFDAKSAAEAFLDTVPPKVREAIKTHEVLVGMNRDMVMYAKGRAPRKIRERDANNTEYEEWIYGQPPQEVTFVRFVGDEVTRVEIMKVTGEKIVRTEKEIDLSKPQPALAQTEGGNQPSTPGAVGPGPKPTLRRPGEVAPAPEPSGQSKPGQMPGQNPGPQPRQTGPPQPVPGPPGPGQIPPTV